MSETPKMAAAKSKLENASAKAVAAYGSGAPESVRKPLRQAAVEAAFELSKVEYDEGIY